VLIITRATGSNPDWAQELIDYLQHDILPINRDEANQVCQRAKSYVMRDDEIHHRSTSRILQRCIPMEDGINLLQDIHLGLTTTMQRQILWWVRPFDKGFTGTTVKDAQHTVRTCEGC
jgi:hypothetical protein